MTPNSLPVTLSLTIDRLFTGSVVDILVVDSSVALIVVVLRKLSRSILAELQLLFEQIDSFIETLSVDFPHPRSIWKLFPKISFCLSGIQMLVHQKDKLC